MRTTGTPHRIFRRSTTTTLLLAAAVSLSACSSPPVPAPSAPTQTTTSAPLATPTAVPTSGATAAAADSGPRENARGAASRLGAGRYRYTVADGDSPTGIASRFNLCVVDIENANSNADPLGTGINVGETLSIERTPGPHHGSDCMLGYQ
jgi:hypothetical protein